MAVETGRVGAAVRGEFPIFEVPGQVNDSAPSVTLSTDKDVYGLGDRVTLTAGPGDDFGVRRVTFFDGPWEVGTADRPPPSRAELGGVPPCRHRRPSSHRP